MGGVCSYEGKGICPFCSSDTQSEFAFTNEVLSSSPSSEVKVAVDRAGIRVAVKCYSKTKCSLEELRLAKQEIKLLQTLNHPRLVKYMGHTQDESNIYLAMELCEKGSLDKLIRSRKVTELIVKQTMRGLFEALEYLHNLHISHRDIKPENILFTSSGEMKLADFGLAKAFGRDVMHSRLGTPYYLAPEVLSGNYTEKIDIWSAGIVLYYCLRGRRPFTSSVYRDLANEIVSGEISDWGNMHPDAIDLVQKLLTRDPEKRPSASEVLRHPWLAV
jgi:calcium-dependent protein kinase